MPFAGKTHFSAGNSDGKIQLVRTAVACYHKRKIYSQVRDITKICLCHLWGTFLVVVVLGCFWLIISESRWYIVGQGRQAESSYTWTANSRQTPTSTYQHVEKSSPSVFSAPKIIPSECTTRIQTHRHLEPVESEDSVMLTSPTSNKAKGMHLCNVLR